MSTIDCLVNIDDINYKITVKLDNNRTVASFDDYLRAIAEDQDLKNYDFTQEYFIFEIFDKTLHEYVRIDEETEIENMSKTRVKILDPDELITEPPKPVVNEDDIPFVELCEDKMIGEILELLIEAHVPKPQLIAKIDNPNITEKTFTVHNIRIKKRMVKSIIKYQGCFSDPAQVEETWNAISDDIRNNLGPDVCNLARDRPELGFVRPSPLRIQKELTALIGQYNRLLRMCSCLNIHEADELWPFFKTFHCHHLKIEVIYPERAPSLKIMQKEFDNADKI